MALISGRIFILLLQNLPGSGVKPPVVNHYLYPPSMGLWSSSRHLGGAGLWQPTMLCIKQRLCNVRYSQNKTPGNNFLPKENSYGSPIFWGAPQGRFLSLDCWTSSIKSNKGLAHCPFLRNGSVSLKDWLPRQFPLLVSSRLWEFPNFLKSIPSLLCMPR